MPKGSRRGTWALAIGFILTVVGFGVILYAIWQAGTIPLTTTTFVGIGLAGVGVASGSAGLDREA